MSFGSSWRLYAKLGDAITKDLIDIYLNRNKTIFLLDEKGKRYRNSIQSAYKKCQKQRQDLMHASLWFEADWKKIIKISTIISEKVTAVRCDSESYVKKPDARMWMKLPNIVIMLCIIGYLTSQTAQSLLKVFIRKF